MRWLLHFWGHEAIHFGALEGFLSMDLETPLFKIKLDRNSALTMLSFVYIRSADFGLQSYFQKFAITTTVQRRVTRI